MEADAVGIESIDRLSVINYSPKFWGFTVLINLIDYLIDLTSGPSKRLAFLRGSQRHIYVDGSPPSSMDSQGVTRRSPDFLFLFCRLISKARYDAPDPTPLVDACIS